ncbi:hypothetical protein EI71_01137 [Anaeroplasma bactoclasticum]|jgi:hypothetical protein|uniref:ABC-2 family transporter n=1 Tax=Anaeroplasma bactoclasticum TaxID=2088 RepID=A0A397RQ55_9MOLU|nr:hypothetical protein [Anaeroplasma bactoclasticum]RIA75838.1 hypothetical protein EI71_01137 [Anaeroplasma bactoclasticum]
MKRRKEKKLISLTSLYLNYTFQKATILVFSISLAFMVIALIVIANPMYDRNSYLLSPESYHQVYFNGALFVINLFNGIIITTISILLFLQSNSFDALFLPNTKRSMLLSIKILASVILFLLLSLFEFVLLYGIPLFLYSSYKMDISSMLTILYLFLGMIFDFSISIILSILVPTIFSPMIVLFISLVKNMISTTFFSIKEVISEILPLLTYNNGIIMMPSVYIIPIFSLLFLFIYYLLYNIRDIKIS